MKTLPDNILLSIQQAPAGQVHTAVDFTHIGSRAAVDQALSRLSRQGLIRRIGRGLYDLPRVNPRFNIAVPPAVDQVAAADARRSGSRLLPSGAAAANMLGLSTQVPAKVVYLTDGRSRDLKVGNQQIHLRHISSRNFNVSDQTSALVIQALRHLGRHSVNDRVISILRSRLSSSQRKALQSDVRMAPGWIANAVKGLDSDDATTHNL